MKAIGKIQNDTITCTMFSPIVNVVILGEVTKVQCKREQLSVETELQRDKLNARPEMHPQEPTGRTANCLVCSTIDVNASPVIDQTVN